MLFLSPLLLAFASTGTAARQVALTFDTTTPEGYVLAFGPDARVNDRNAETYMTSIVLPEYNVEECASACNDLPPNPSTGSCKYFNIWRTAGSPADTFTCAMYSLPTTLWIEANSSVTASRGYRRVSVVVDAGFEGFQCDSPEDDGNPNWLALYDAEPVDAAVIQDPSSAHSGVGFGRLGSIDLTLPGTLITSERLNTAKGRVYQIQLFHRSIFLESATENESFVDVIWNDQVAGSIRSSSAEWEFFSFPVVAQGEDHLAFYGGRQSVWSLIDDVYCFMSQLDSVT